jgi:hypothetical protein
MVTGMTTTMTVVVLMKLIAKAVMMNECIRVRGMVCLITQRFLTRVRHGVWVYT